MEADASSVVKPGRVVRALGLMAASVLAIGFAAVVYVHSQLSPVSTMPLTTKLPHVVNAPATYVIYVGDPNELTKPPEGRIEWRVRPPSATP